MLSEGSYGVVFQGVDLMSFIDAGKHGQVYQPIIFKFTQHHQTNDREFNVQQQIEQNSRNQGLTSVIPRLCGKGQIVLLDPIFS